MEGNEYICIQYSRDLESTYLEKIKLLIGNDLSEPYSTYVYRYFLIRWPELCFLAIRTHDQSLIGVIICKLERRQYSSELVTSQLRGYIAMLAVDLSCRRQGIAHTLAMRSISYMKLQGAYEIILETEEDNYVAINLYQHLGFLSIKKLHRYYLNGSHAFRLVLPIIDHVLSD
jgi:peptide alpha-N-acetyltransferase